MLYICVKLSLIRLLFAFLQLFNYLAGFFNAILSGFKLLLKLLLFLF